MKSKPSLYGVIGNPISGSKSPWIHKYVFDNCGIEGAYLAIDVPSEQLDKTISDLKALDIKGLSVTIPHKSEIMRFLDSVDSSAAVIGAVNTVVCKSGQWKGYNTDGPGLISVLRRHIPDLREKKVLILGAGGAARGISGSLINLGVKKLGIWNRTLEKGIELVEELKSKMTQATMITVLHSKSGFSEYDVVINATSVGMEPEVEHSPVDMIDLSPKAIICDIVYKPHQTKLIQEAIQEGHSVIFGIEMLIEQALLAQQLWHGLSEMDLSQSREALIKAFEMKYGK